MDLRKYPAKWTEIARKVKSLAGWKCKMCKTFNDRSSGFALTVHHIDGDRENNKPRNLVAVCQRCHLKLESARRRRLKEQVEVRMGQGFLFGGG